MSLPRHPQYKDSGVAWLGKVPSHWQVHRLKNLFEIRKRVVGEEGHQVLSITQRGIKVKDIESNDGQLSMDYSKYQIVHPGDFAMNHMDLLTGFVDISPYAGVTSPDYRVFAVRDGVLCEPRYFLYLLQNAYRQKIFYAFGQGASEFGRWRFPTDQFNDFRFPYPPPGEQTAVATFLDRETGKIDALIAEQEKLLTLLAEKRQATISHAVTKGLNPDVPMKDSGVAWLGEVPRHWKLGQLKNFICQKSGAIKTGPFGSHLTSAEMQQGEIKVYNQRSVIDNNFIDGDSYISQEKFMQLSSFQTFPGDVLVTTRGTIGRAAILPESADIGILHPCLLRVQVDETKLQREFLVALIQDSHLMKTQIALNSNATTIEVIYSETMASLFIPLPPVGEQGKILNFLNTETARLDALTTEATHAIALLKERRSALIAAAVTGKIDVRGLITEPEAA